MDKITNKKALESLEKNYDKATELLNDKDEMERFLQRLEKKLEEVPLVGEKLAMLPIFVSLVKSYIKKEYTDIPIGTIIAIVSALIYFVSPFDLVPDAIPGVGLIDDALVATACWKLVESDVEEYKKWRETNHKNID